MPKLKVDPVMKEQCATCPFRKGSPYASIAEDFILSGELLKHTRICHCTAESAIMGKTGKPARVCRGARDWQLNFFVAVGFLDEPTDAAWSKKLGEIEVCEQTIAE
jgi:hypothetical protein